MDIKAAYTKLSGLDLSRPMQYLRERMGYSDPELLEEVREEYVRYMSLVAAHPDMTLPTCKEVDDLWHAHLLCTHQYLEMCGAIGAGFIHHNPCLSSDAGTIVGSYNRDTLGLYRAQFGEPHPFWTADQELCAGDRDYCNSVFFDQKNMAAALGERQTHAAQ